MYILYNKADNQKTSVKNHDHILTKNQLQKLLLKQNAQESQCL